MNDEVAKFKDPHVPDREYKFNTPPFEMGTPNSETKLAIEFVPV